MQATILSAEVRRAEHGPDHVILHTDDWGDFALDVPRGGGPDYAAAVGLGSVNLVTLQGFAFAGERVEVGPKARPDDASAVIAFSSAQITEPVEGGPVTVVLDTRSPEGSNAGAYEHDFELAFPSRADAAAYLKVRGFTRATVAKPRLAPPRNGPRNRGAPRTMRDGSPLILMLSEVEAL